MFLNQYDRCAMGNSKSNHHELGLREMPQKVRELHYAVMSNDREAVSNLLAQGVNVNFPWYNPSNPSVKDGSTPLICAVSLNHLEIIEVRQHCKNVFCIKMANKVTVIQ